jgi:calcineurin-like phosphoesterase family protein
MWTKYKFEHNENHRVFFTSDTHFCHNKSFIYEKRGYETIEKHDEGIIEKWNSVVKPTDSVIHLGDFLVGAGRDSESKGRRIMSRLNGHKYLLWGNHNAFVKDVYKKEIQKLNLGFGDEHLEIYPLTVNNLGQPFTYVGQYMLCVIKTKTKYYTIFCSHFAHRIWIDSHKGDVLHCSGHSHGSDPESQPLWGQHKRLDVGIDNFGLPISLDVVIDIMNKKDVKAIDHHNKQTNPSF